MKAFVAAHTHSLMSAIVFALLVALNVAHVSNPAIAGVAALLMTGLHLDGVATKYLAANSARAETISRLAQAIGAGLKVWSDSHPPAAPVDTAPITKRDIKVAAPFVPPSGAS